MDKLIYKIDLTHTPDIVSAAPNHCCSVWPQTCPWLVLFLSCHHSLLQLLPGLTCHSSGMPLTYPAPSLPVTSAASDLHLSVFICCALIWDLPVLNDNFFLSHELKCRLSDLFCLPGLTCHWPDLSQLTCLAAFIQSLQWSKWTCPYLSCCHISRPGSACHRFSHSACLLFLFVLLPPHMYTDITWPCVLFGCSSPDVHLFALT